MIQPTMLVKLMALKALQEAELSNPHSGLSEVSLSARAFYIPVTVVALGRRFKSRSDPEPEPEPDPDN